MEKGIPIVDFKKDNPFRIGESPVDRLAPFKKLIGMRVSPSKILTSGELENLRTRDVEGLTVDGIRSFLSERLAEADLARAYNHNPFRTRETEDALIYDGIVANESMLKQAEEVAAIKRKPLKSGSIPPEEAKNFRTMYVSLIDEKVQKADKAGMGITEEELFRDIQDMIDDKKYNEASAYLLKIARLLWPHHEKRVKEHLGDDRKRQIRGDAEIKESPYNTYWSRQIRKYLDWATVLAKSVNPETKEIF